MNFDYFKNKFTELKDKYVTPFKEQYDNELNKILENKVERGKVVNDKIGQKIQSFSDTFYGIKQKAIDTQQLVQKTLEPIWGKVELKKEDIVPGSEKYGSQLSKYGDIVTGNEQEGYKAVDVTGAVPKKLAKQNLEQAREMAEETFDISGKVDTNNPIYKFYEKDLGRYLKSKYNAQLITDEKGVKWFEVDLTKKPYANLPVEAFGIGALGYGLKSPYEPENKKSERASDKYISDAGYLKAGDIDSTKEVVNKSLPENYRISSDEKDKIVSTIIAEALGEGEEGMKAVLNVINNRANTGNIRDFGKNVFGVIAHPRQFSAFSVNNEIYSKVRDYLMGKNDNLSPQEKKAVEYVQQLYEDMVNGKLKDTTKGSMFYMNPGDSDEANRKWMETRPEAVRIGRHVFYK